MHFVKKVPTTEEERAAKEKEHEKKTKKYLFARDRIFEKRENGEFDDEILALTQAVLEKNCDHYTLWNIRRNTIELRITENKKTQASDASAEEKEKSLQQVENLLSGELFLSYECIKGNPKSYSAWFQRGWVIERQSSPNLENELALCEKALKLDCRNFHVWDHRRIVAALAHRTDEQELEFSNKLISENFSNYSAWHYRSIGLKRSKNETTGETKLSENVVKEELEKVKSAIYMDAEDSSAWSYIRWLLEVGSSREFMRSDSSTAPVPLSASFHGTNTTIVMSRACTLPVVLSFTNTDDSTSWRGFSSLSQHPTAARVWQYMSDTPLKLALDGGWVELTKSKYVNKELLKKVYQVTPLVTSSPIKSLIDDTESLIQLEPQNKWPLYMKTLCLIEYRPSEAHEEIINNLKKLAAELDTKRKELYTAIASKQLICQALRKDDTLEKLMSGDEDRLKLADLGLTTLEGAEYLAGLVYDIDLSGNHLKTIGEVVLPNLNKLTIDNNPIKKFSPSVSLGKVDFLSIAMTEVATLDDVIPCLQTLSSLKVFLFCQTQLVDRRKELGEALPGVRLIPYYL